jgi:phosphohistidine phosphatase
VRLLIVRHAIAVPHGTKGIPDNDRPLTPRGIERFESAAKGLARAFARPDALLTSPWKRARQTADILSAAFGGPTPKETKALTNAHFDVLLREIRAQGASATVAVVGHEPWLSALLARLLGSSADESFEFKKGGVAIVDFDGPPTGRGHLAAYLPPKLMRQLR